MPEFTALHLAMLASLFAVGIGLGWLLRGDRCAREKIAINAGWQEQLEARQSENDRLAEQNRGLMQQVSDHQACGSDSEARTKELAASLRESLEERERLQRNASELRDGLDGALAERERLEKELESSEKRLATVALALKEKESKVYRLSRQLSAWQERVPPLAEKYRQRDREVQELQSDLDRAVNRIAELEAITRPDETHIEAVDDEALGRLDACNDQYGECGEEPFAAADDSIAVWSEPLLSLESHVAPAVDRPPAGGDDLQQIKGVGPAIEKTLNELGIYRFEQIAGISEYDIDRIAVRIKGFRTRIYREDWIGQARALARADPK